MGIFKAIGSSISGAFRDQWKEIITAPEFDEYQVFAPGLLKTEGSQNTKGTEGVISNGSIVHVPKNTAMVVFGEGGIEHIITEPGKYKYTDGEESIFAGGGLLGIAKNAIGRVGFGGVSSMSKKVAFLNLREIRNIKFGTRGAQIYHDSFYDCDLEVFAYGSFTIKVVNPELFIRNFIPANVFEYNFLESNARSQLLSDFLQSFIVALNTLSKNYRISEIAAHANEVSSTIRGDKLNAASWKLRFGIDIVQVSVENIEFSDESKELVNTYNKNKLSLRAYEGISEKASNIVAQQKIAEGIRDNGMGNIGGMIFATNFANGLNPAAGKIENPKMSYEEQIATLKKLKELVDIGILSEEEFQIKKKEILGI